MISPIGKTYFVYEKIYPAFPFAFGDFGLSEQQREFDIFVDISRQESD